MRTLDELGISPAPWFARLGIMEGDFVNSGAEDNEDGQVCIVTSDKYDKPIYYALKKRHADARLIAAAPMLYEALRGLLDIVCDECKAWRGESRAKCVGCPRVKAARAALAAASGESEKGKTK